MSKNAIGKAGQKSTKSSGEMPQGRISKLTYKSNDYLNADKHPPSPTASSARSTKRWVRGDAYVSGS